MPNKNNKIQGAGFAVWGECTEEKVKKAIEDKFKKLINDEKLAEEIKLILKVG